MYQLVFEDWTSQSQLWSDRWRHRWNLKPAALHVSGQLWLRSYDYKINTFSALNTVFVVNWLYIKSLFKQITLVWTVFIAFVGFWVISLLKTTQNVVWLIIIGMQKTFLKEKKFFVCANYPFVFLNKTEILHRISSLFVWHITLLTAERYLLQQLPY